MVVVLDVAFQRNRWRGSLLVSCCAPTGKPAKTTRLIAKNPRRLTQGDIVNPRVARRTIAWTETGRIVAAISERFNLNARIVDRVAGLVKSRDSRTLVWPSPGRGFVSEC